MRTTRTTEPIDRSVALRCGVAVRVDRSSGSAERATGSGPTSPARASRRGAALVEFAFIALAFYLLLAGTFEMGRMVFASQALQNAARVGARELALVPAPATWTFDQLLFTPFTDPNYATVTATVREDVYDPGLLALVIPSGTSDAELEAQLAAWPVVNRMLVPLMLRERVTVDGAEVDMLRYPGALLRNPTPGPFSPNPYIVAIPRVVSRDDDGVETIEWLPVLEEVRPVPGDPATGPYSMTPASGGSGAPQRGLVAIRLNYPFQAATLSAFRDNPSTAAPNDVVRAADGSVSAAPPPGEYANPTGINTTYSGQYGLGTQLALGQEVRPFRRLISAQSIFRREVFVLEQE